MSIYLYLFPIFGKAAYFGFKYALIRQNFNNFQGAHFSLNAQLRNHGIITSRIKSILGSEEEATKHLNQCLYSVGMGSNDLGFYFVLQRFRQRTPEQYVSDLIDQYSQQLTVTCVIRIRSTTIYF